MQTCDKDAIDELLPNRQIDINVDVQDVREESIKKHEHSLNSRYKSYELAKIKLKEKREQERVEKYDGYTSFTEFKEADTQKKIENAKLAIKNAEASQPLVLVNKDQITTSGVTKPEIMRLMAKLNINLNIQLTRSDTMNLLATLLTCNEAQLKALEKNQKVPVAIKIVINRLLKDSAVGNIETIERLWDRVFGKAPAIVDTPEGYNSILPNKPVTREAYILIRQTLMGQE